MPGRALRSNTPMVGLSDVLACILPKVTYVRMCWAGHYALEMHSNYLQLLNFLRHLNCTSHAHNAPLALQALQQPFSLLGAFFCWELFNDTGGITCYTNSSRSQRVPRMIHRSARRHLTLAEHCQRLECICMLSLISREHSYFGTSTTECLS
jgi:hypothetical protein